MAIHPALIGVISGGAAGFAPITATGGTITDSGDYRYHKFTSSGTFEITANPEASTVEVNILAGGSGTNANQGGGGGEWIALTGQTGAVDTYPIVVGAGGGYGGDGVDSSAYGTTADHGISYAGSGKGGTCGNGNLGGQNSQPGGNGGGGMGAVGGIPSYSWPCYHGGGGGSGLSHAVWTGVSLVFPGAGGGGGAGNYCGYGGSGGYLGGGAGAVPDTVAGNNATVNTGGGGGGAGNNAYPLPGGLGGSGMVVLRYTLVAP